MPGPTAPPDGLDSHHIYDEPFANGPVHLPWPPHITPPLWQPDSSGCYPTLRRATWPSEEYVELLLFFFYLVFICPGNSALSPLEVKASQELKALGFNQVVSHQDILFACLTVIKQYKAACHRVTALYNLVDGIQHHLGDILEYYSLFHSLRATLREGGVLSPNSTAAEE
jgi:hypothetical protein